MRNYVIIFIQVITYYYEKMVVGLFSLNVLYFERSLHIYLSSKCVYLCNEDLSSKEGRQSWWHGSQTNRYRDKTLNTIFDPV